MPHIEIVSFSATAPGAAGAAGVALAGDSLIIKNAADDTKIKLLALWAKHQTAGWVQINSPLMHDSTRGIRLRSNAINVQNLLEFPANQEFYPQDTIATNIAGSAVGGDVELASMLVYYENLPGINARLVDFDFINNNIKNLVTVYHTITSVAGPAYTGAAALNAQSDLLHANTDYALLGIISSAINCTVTVRGSDSGNVRVGVPGDPVDVSNNGRFFYNLSKKHNLPLIPVFNSANKASIFIEVSQDENAVAVVASLIFAEL